MGAQQDDLDAAVYFAMSTSTERFTKALSVPNQIRLRAVGRSEFLLEGPTASLIAYKKKFIGTLVANAHIAMSAALGEKFPKLPLQRLQLSIDQFIEPHEYSIRAFVPLQCPWTQQEQGYLKSLSRALETGEKWPGQFRDSLRLKWLAGSCANCGKYWLRLLYCGKCRTVRYCGRDCQAQHWRGTHKAACAPPASGPSLLSVSRDTGLAVPSACRAQLIDVSLGDLVSEGLLRVGQVIQSETNSGVATIVDSSGQVMLRPAGSDTNVSWEAYVQRCETSATDAWQRVRVKRSGRSLASLRVEFLRRSVARELFRFVDLLCCTIH